MLDLDSAEWVQGRIMGGCEVEVDGERWVYDLESSTDGDDRQGGSVSGDSSGRGEWRRRRWVRIVQRGRVTGESSTRRHRVRDRISHRKDDGGGR